MRKCLAIQKLKDLLGVRNTFGDKITVKDEVLVYAGKKLLFKSKGHIVNAGLIGLVNFMGIAQVSSVSNVPSAAWAAKGQYMRVGTGGTVTQAGTTGLTTIDNTAASSQSGALTNVSTGIYRISWSAVWNAGVLGAIDVSEIGLWLYLLTNLQAFGATGVSAATAFFSRISVADGDFNVFTVNVAVPLTIEWRLTFTFA